MTLSYQVFIPARFASTRLPGKVLEPIGDKPLLQHVYESACQSRADGVLIATDDERVADVAGAFGADVVMTQSGHVSGTERLAEVAKTKALPEDTIIVNLQGDEIGMPPALLDQVAGLLEQEKNRNMATLCEAISDPGTLDNPDIVKVVFDKHQRALYFSRAPIPWPRVPEASCCYRHIGLYAYRAAFLETYSLLPAAPLEVMESLEQLRALYHGETIYVDIALEQPGMGIDTPEDLARARALFDAGG